MSDTPNRADKRINALSRILDLAVDNEIIESNKAKRIEKLYSGSRRDILWTNSQINRFRSQAPEPLVRALNLALWTGQRQGDLLRLRWDSFDGQNIKLKQSKTGKIVFIKCFPELIEMLNNLDRTATTILTNAHGLPWKTGFGQFFSRWRNRCEIEGVTFHDLRGTFITLAKAKGYPISKICLASGHSEKKAESVINAHYSPVDLTDSVFKIVK